MKNALTTITVLTVTFVALYGIMTVQDKYLRKTCRGLVISDFLGYATKCMEEPTPVK